MIDVHSEVGKGTDFVVRIPVKAQREKEDSMPEPEHKI